MINVSAIWYENQQRKGASLEATNKQELKLMFNAWLRHYQVPTHAKFTIFQSDLDKQELENILNK